VLLELAKAKSMGRPRVSQQAGEKPSGPAWIVASKLGCSACFGAWQPSPGSSTLCSSRNRMESQMAGSPETPAIRQMSRTRPAGLGQ